MSAAIGPDLVGHELESVHSRWDDREARLYAIAVGAGSVDPYQELQYTTENTAGITQAVLPTFAVLPGCRVGVRSLLNALDSVDLSRMLHGEQQVEIHAPIPVAAEVTTTGAVTAVWDKQKAAVVETEAVTTCRDSGTRLFTCRQSLFFRGYGGWGGQRGPKGDPVPPRGTPTRIVRFRTRSDQALLYRLTGDSNALHSDPEVARRAGFARPISHGLCTYGWVARVLVNEVLDGDTTAVQAFKGRFTAPSYPGDELTVEVWPTTEGHAFSVLNARGDTVVDDGVLASR